jgi:hypothetical protein
MTLQQTLRYQANKRLLEILSRLIENNPDLRFSQILYSFGFVKGTRPANPDLGVDWQNEFYKEPNEILERVNRRAEDIDGRKSTTETGK